MLTGVKKAVGRMPILGGALKRAYRAACGRGGAGFSSSHYWDQRYRTGGNSGPGSYNHLAQFKAEVLNRFVRDHDVKTIIEFGCGDGGQLQLADYPCYVGVDVSASAIERCRKTYHGDDHKTFFLASEMPLDQAADLALSLDVVYHLVEDKVFEAHMHRLFQAAGRYVIIYSSNHDNPTPETHVRHRTFSRWIDQNQPEWQLCQVIKNRYPFDAADPENTSFSDFFIYQRR